MPCTETDTGVSASITCSTSYPTTTFEDSSGNVEDDSCSVVGWLLTAPTLAHGFAHVLCFSLICRMLELCGVE